MKTKETTIILSTAFIALSLVFTGFATLKKTSQSEIFDITYSIPRLKRFVPDFLLRDRKVNHHGLKKEGLIAARPMPQAKTNDNKKPVAAAKPNAKKDPAAKKPVAQNSKAKPTKKKSFKVEVIGNTLNEGFAKSTDKFSPQVSSGGGFGGGAPVIKDHSQISQQLKNSPSKELMNEWVRLFLAKEINKDSFYNLLADLLETNDERSQSVALYGLASTPSYESFSQLAAASEILSGNNKAQADRYLAAYSHPDYLKILELALSSKTPIVVEKAVYYVAELAKRMRSTMLARFPNTADNVRASRGEPSVIPPATFNKTLELLRTISKGNDSHLAGLANESISTISQILET